MLKNKIADIQTWANSKIHCIIAGTKKTQLAERETHWTNHNKQNLHTLTCTCTDNTGHVH